METSMKTTLTIALFLIAAIGYAQDTISEPIVPTYAEMTISEYYEFNAKVSEALGFSIGEKTERLLPMNINTFGYDNDSILKVIVCLEKHVLKYYSKQLKDINKIARKDTTFESIEVEFIDQKTFDWFGKHYAKNGDMSKKWIYINKDIDKEQAPKEVKDKTQIK